MWKRGHSTDKRYPGDNRLIPPKSSHRRRGLAPRCRLVASWGWSRSQGLGCSPMQAARELGSERRETVGSLSAEGDGGLRGAGPSTRGPGSTDRRGLALGGRLVRAWGGSRSQELGCSPVKAARELGAERRETVRSLSAESDGGLRGAGPSTRGPGWTDRWWTSCGASCKAG